MFELTEAVIEDKRDALKKAKGVDTIITDIAVDEVKEWFKSEIPHCHLKIILGRYVRSRLHFWGRFRSKHLETLQDEDIVNASFSSRSTRAHVQLVKNKKAATELRLFILQTPWNTRVRPLDDTDNVDDTDADYDDDAGNGIDADNDTDADADADNADIDFKNGVDTTADTDIDADDDTNANANANADTDNDDDTDADDDNDAVTDIKNGVDTSADANYADTDIDADDDTEADADAGYAIYNVNRGSFFLETW